MTTEEKLAIVTDQVGDLAPDEETTAREMLEKAGSQFGGTYSPAYVARWIAMHRAAGKKTA
jgi:hypothetical protein